MSDSNPTSKTVFIVGAGASKEVGLPIGSELKGSIAKALDLRFEKFYRRVSGDGHIFEALQLAATKEPKRTDYLASLQHACWRIRDAMPQASSIDNFLDTHSVDKEIELCGKLAIVRTILEAESKSALFIDPLQSNRPMKFEGLESTWFNRFFRYLLGNCKPSDIGKRLSSVALVIFNYDRCIEHYLYHAIQNYYSMSASDVAQLLQRLEIYHPYGTVGSLPWLKQHNAIEYGASTNSGQLLQLTSQIKTFTEGTDESSSDVNSIRLNMKSSNRLVFLGFAFHDLNMDLLLPSFVPLPDQSIGRRIFATAYGISDSDTETISAELESKSGTLGRKIHIRNKLTCSGLFQEYSRSMSFT
jgi:hypothetical protein